MLGYIVVNMYPLNRTFIAIRNISRSLVCEYVDIYLAKFETGLLYITVKQCERVTH